MEIGFSNRCELGESVLPSYDYGPITCFNATGKYIKLENEPMETVYRVGEWRWKDWGGGEHTKLVDIPYKRYRRKFVKPPSVELVIRTESIICTINTFVFEPKDYESIKHSINLFLEIFGECEIYTENLVPVLVGNIKKLNWELLPKGKYPWEELNRHLTPVIQKTKEGNKKIVGNRLQIISTYNPDFVAVGKSGFYGYVVFGFKEKDMFVLESVFYGNATYVFDNNWETLSILSKAEILEENLQKDRIIHTANWESEINLLFGNSSSLFN